MSNDPLSIDCGGDCWGCVGDMEANLGFEPSLKKVRCEFEQGLRPGWVEPNRPNNNLEWDATFDYKAERSRR